MGAFIGFIIYIVVLTAGSTGLLSFSISPNTARLITEHYNQIFQTLKFWRGNWKTKTGVAETKNWGCITNSSGRHILPIFQWICWNESIRMKPARCPRVIYTRFAINLTKISHLWDKMNETYLNVGIKRTKSPPGYWQINISPPYWKQIQIQGVLNWPRKQRKNQGP